MTDSRKAMQQWRDNEQAKRDFAASLPSSGMGEFPRFAMRLFTFREGWSSVNPEKYHSCYLMDLDRQDDPGGLWFEIIEDYEQESVGSIFVTFAELDEGLDLVPRLVEEKEDQAAEDARKAEVSREREDRARLHELLQKYPEELELADDPA